MSGQSWCLFARRGLGPGHLAGLLPVPTSVPGAGRVSDKASWEAGIQRGMELPLRARLDLQLQHAQPGSVLCLAGLDGGNPQGAALTDTLLATEGVWVHPANPTC